MVLPTRNTFKRGDWLVACDVCGKEIYASEALHRWDGFIVCKKDFETRHPMDFLKVPKDESLVVPFTSPEPADTFVSVSYISTGTDSCTGAGRTGSSDYATADCARADISIYGTR